MKCLHTLIGSEEQENILISVPYCAGRYHFQTLKMTAIDLSLVGSANTEFCLPGMPQIRKQHKIPERNLRKATQKKTAPQERFYDHHELEENSKLGSKLVFLKRVSTSKHCHKCHLDIESLKHNSVVNNYKRNCVRGKLCESHKYDRALWHLEKTQHKNVHASNMVYTSSIIICYLYITIFIWWRIPMNVIKARLFVIIHPVGNRSKLLMERNVINVINKSHMGKKQYECKECGKVFHRFLNLKETCKNSHW
ncbi:hypothetical protein GH733_005094 [Mirounga leonina]|nr:hypothetical protein GH733_005094 [Mirounga leonina]